MALSSGDKWALGGLALLLLGIAAAAGAAQPDHDDDDDDDRDDRPLRAGRELELAVLAAMADRHGETNVLDNVSFEDDEGCLFRPDTVVLGRGNSIRQVREQKDVAELRPSHVLQAARYDTELEPRRGTVLDVAGDTLVPEDVCELARDFGIGIERWEE